MALLKLLWTVTNGLICSLHLFILQGTMDGYQRRARPGESWKNNIKKWTGHSMSSLLHIADDRGQWAVISTDASAEVPQRRLGVMGIS